jgi:hypothetical protein
VAGLAPDLPAAVLVVVHAPGPAGLLAIHFHGGAALVQDPADALFSDMPANALVYVPTAEALQADAIAARLRSSCAPMRRHGPAGIALRTTQTAPVPIRRRSSAAPSAAGRPGDAIESLSPAPSLAEEAGARGRSSRD